MARLTQVLSSFIEAGENYALARLEFALRHPRLPSPPVLSVPFRASEAWARACWDAIEAQLESTRRYVGALDGLRLKRPAHDSSYSRLEGTVRELDRYGRAVRWAMTVDERGLR